MTPDEVWSYIFKALGIIVPLGGAILKVRDMVLSNRSRVELVERESVEIRKEASKQTADLRHQIEELEQKREKDLVEHNSLKLIATSIDTKIDSKLKDYTRENADARHKDYVLFSEALHKVDKTLAEINATLKHLRGDVDSLKKKDS